MRRRMETNFIIILNDNNMSISENVGGVSKYLNNIRTSNAYLDIKDRYLRRTAQHALRRWRCDRQCAVPKTA